MGKGRQGATLGDYRLATLNSASQFHYIAVSMPSSPIIISQRPTFPRSLPGLSPANPRPIPGLSPVSPRSGSVLSPFSLRSLSVLFPVSPRSLPGLSPVSPRSLLGLSLPVRIRIALGSELSVRRIRGRRGHRGGNPRISTLSDS